jgi:ribose transport system ATP-binding protein
MAPHSVSETPSSPPSATVSPRSAGAEAGSDVVVMTQLVKQFPGTLAVDRVDLTLRAGEVHALLGENGAGKSTMIKILAGVYGADSGDVAFRGAPVNPQRDSLPIAFIHQDLGLIETMTVGENIALTAGYARRRGGLISWARVGSDGAAILDVLGSDIDPDATVTSLSAAERSIVAIARALATQAEVVVLDEPTASLPESDVARLFEVLERLRDNGTALLYVTHRLDEVSRLADHVSVLRDGRRVHSSRVSDTTPQELIQAIVGRPLSEVFVEPDPPASATLLSLAGVRTGDVGPIDLQLAPGEVLGLVGLRGAGQNQLGRALMGIEPLDAGIVRLDGQTMSASNPRKAIAGGLAFLSSKRLEESVADTLSVKENLYLNPAVLGRAVLSPLPRRAETRRAAVATRTFGVRPADPERVLGTLSGGNQQKVVLARAMTTDARVLILEEPTQGVDIGAKAEIYALLRAAAADGKGVLLASSDFEEVSGLCHRAIVLNRGSVVAVLDRSQLSVHKLTELATGASAGADSQGGSHGA